jgi:AraC family transcriptional regulator
MDWLTGMNSVVRHIEDNLTQPVHCADLSQMLGLSQYEFSRIFSFLAGMSPSEYVRRRRLSQAAFDMQNGSEKIIDIALKYCYESPTAFTRAFKELHGIAPLTVRNRMGVPLKICPILKFILTIKGVNEMNYKIVEKPEFNVIGVKLPFKERDNGDGKLLAQKIAELPQTQLDLLKSLAVDGAEGFVGVFARHYLGNTVFIFGVESTEVPPEGLSKHTVPAAKWAVLEGENNEPNLHERFYTEWLPASGYKRAQPSYPIIEVYNFENTEITFANKLWAPVDSPADIARKFNEGLAELEKIANTSPRNAPVDIDLRAMTPHKGAKELQISYTNDGKMVLYTPTGDGRMATPQTFTAPLKIELRAMTRDTNIRLYYGESPNNRHGAWCHFLGTGSVDETPSEVLCINDLRTENMHWHEGANKVPINEFVDIEWVLGEKVMGVKVNGVVRVASCEYEYIKSFKNGFSVTGPVYAASGRGSTVTIEKLRVTEL